ncbi:hypothetical protein lpari_03890 [Legionella parisiensis]|uniref:Uncharacterized protein n=1 Tax=Legionella parisiensis TaxID=45071 RepID=A0A1E5JKW3_9GAMM|nr:hypothetical protein [Legionella parisiensis]OEH45120.1 hypothetical protein lpari_03890 [Legionella parisiensis]
MTQKKLQLQIGKIFHNTVERTADKDKVKRFLELFCYKKLLDSKKINKENISSWNNLPVLANQCKQINYCLPEALTVADSVLDSYRKLKALIPKPVPKQDDGNPPDRVQAVHCIVY